MNYDMQRLIKILTASLLLLPFCCYAEDAAEGSDAGQDSALFSPSGDDRLAIPPELERIASEKPGEPQPEVAQAAKSADVGSRAKSAAAPAASEASPAGETPAAPAKHSAKKLKKVPHANPSAMPANLKIPEGMPGKPPSLPPGLKPPTERPGVPGNSRKSAEITSSAQPNSTLKITALALPEVKMDETVGNLDFSDMPVNDLLDMLQNFTGKAILRQSTIAGTFTFKSQGVLTRRQAIEAIVSLLALNGVAVSPVGSLYLKAVPATAAANNAPFLIEDSTLEYEPSQEMCSKLFHIDFMAVPEAVTALSGCQSGLVGTSVIPFEKNSSVLATDCITNLQRMETLLSKIDKPSKSSQKILFFALKNVAARDAMSRCQQLLAGPMAARFQGNTTVDADERTNQLIAYTHPANEAILRELVENLDRDVEPLTRTEMFNVRHADATDLCDVIKEVITGQKQVRNETTTTSSKNGAGAQANKQQPGAQQNNPRAQQANQAQTVVDNAGTQFSNYITIVPDERSNNIVATGTPSDIKLLGQIIEKLDAILPQVRIEVLIVDVTLTKNQNSGFDSFGIRYGKTDADGNSVGVGNGLGGGNKDVWLSPTVQNSAATVDAFSLENFSMNMVLNVAKSNSNVKVLSAPCIVTTHNREATITVGTKEPVVSSYSTSTSSDEDNATSISYEDIALELTVKPLIGSNGVVQLEITQKYNEVGDYVTIGDYSQPEVITREATSFVSVADGKMVVLGGLQKSQKTKVRDSVYILGDIPLLGRLFRPSTDTEKRDDLLIFIRPVILNNPEESNADAQKMLSRMDTAKEANHYLETGRFDEEEKKDAKSEDSKADKTGQASDSNKVMRHKGK
jgi:general secretion pathway protein D